MQTALAAVSEQGAQLGSDASERTHAAMPCGSRAGGGRGGARALVIGRVAAESLARLSAEQTPLSSPVRGEAVQVGILR